MADPLNINEIFFCSANVGKYEHLLLNTQHIGLIKITQKDDLDIIEPQLNTIEEIALYKAQHAYKKLKKPVIVQDSGLIIKELQDFPGPYTKYVSKTIGCKGILKLLEGSNDRSCGFHACLVFIDQNGTSHIFNQPHKPKYWGKIALNKDVWHVLNTYQNENQSDAANGNSCLGRLAASWSSSNPNESFWTIFIPLDISDLPENEKTLAQLSEDEMISYRKSRKSCFKDFANWLEKNMTIVLGN